MSQKNKKFQYKVTFWWVFTIFMSILTIIEEKKILPPISNFWPLCPSPISVTYYLNGSLPPKATLPTFAYPRLGTADLLESNLSVFLSPVHGPFLVFKKLEFGQQEKQNLIKNSVFLLNCQLGIQQNFLFFAPAELF
jgi:hypothetical protein